ncbi:Succinate dehydrogenase [ubiquinone] flavoprotein subunit [Fusarium oxysporum f. sp. albedinis]|nr:Succinate dehydrogenase [ubiquinone] flavoprotein subunit [Fusarium oxysporum f. sp. albedinis]
MVHPNDRHFKGLNTGRRAMLRYYTTTLAQVTLEHQFAAHKFGCPHPRHIETPYLCARSGKTRSKSVLL